MKTTTPKFEIGDTVDVHVRILEGDKERIQIYNGVVIGRSGAGPARCSSSAGSCRARASSGRFPLHSPRIADIVVKRSGKVRRAKLYYLRQRFGQGRALKERFSNTPARPKPRPPRPSSRAARIAKKEKAKAEKA